MRKTKQKTTRKKKREKGKRGGYLYIKVRKLTGLGIKLKVKLIAKQNKTNRTSLGNNFPIFLILSFLETSLFKRKKKSWKEIGRCAFLAFSKNPPN